MEDAYGDVIQPGHGVDVDAVRGKWIVYTMTAWGTMQSFIPEEHWHDDNLQPIEEASS